jgi:hypothetical protein
MFSWSAERPASGLGDGGSTCYAQTSAGTLLIGFTAFVVADAKR